jgi:hypothetical protein
VSDDDQLMLGASESPSLENDEHGSYPKKLPRKTKSAEPAPTIDSVDDSPPAEPAPADIAVNGPGKAGVDEGAGSARAVPDEIEQALPNTETPRLFYLTNRMNLNGILSSRLVAPRQAFTKYYADLLELCPGWVPVLTTAPTGPLLERVVGEPGSGGPVVLELSHSAVADQQVGVPITYLRAAALTDVIAIHFPDQKALREHRARAYKNVHPHDDLLRVSPELFRAEDRLDLTISAPSGAAETDWATIDRIRGSVSALIAAGDSGEALAVAAAALGTSAGIPRDVAIPPWLNWGELSGRPGMLPEQDAESEADRLVFQAAYRVLGHCDKSDSWSPLQVLEDIAKTISAAKPGEEAGKVIDRNLQHVRKILNIEQEFKPFRNPESPHVAAKSLLMVLLRPDLDQLLAWPVEESGADETTRVVAAVLAGRLRGLARESAALRREIVDDLTATWAVRVAYGGATGIGIAAFKSDKSETALLVDDRLMRTSAPLMPEPAVLYKALAEKARTTSRVAVARHFGWPVALRVDLPVGAVVERTDSAVTITAVEKINASIAVDEADFLTRLNGLRGRLRRKANELLSKAK